jgi:hypothetical protein
VCYLVGALLLMRVREARREEPADEHQPSEAAA